ncbi:MAG: DUF1292 domain-containing protein [Bacilli bacterium]|nr:DUF1292 domain-containing protein [Bacilli bacterium]
MEKENIFTIIDNKGKERQCEVLFTFESDETKKNYIVYTDNTLDHEGNVRVYASIYNQKDKGVELEPINSEREWKIVETILSSIQEESKKEGN